MNNCKLSANQIIPENIFLHDIEEISIKSLEVDPIDFCNHACYWCFTAKSRSKNVISTKNLKDYLTRFVESGGKSVHFSGGGEPLLFKPLYEPTQHFPNNILNYCFENDLATGIITNGVLLDRILNKTEITKLSFLRISLDAYNSENYSFYHKCKESDFKAVLNNISMIRAKTNSCNTSIGISFIVDYKTEINNSLKDIEEISKIAKSLNVDFVQFKHLHTTKNVLADGQMKKIHKYCMENDWGNIEYWVHRYNVPNPKGVCKITNYIQAIGAKGEKYPCCHLFGNNTFINQEKFIPTPITVHNCPSKVCRYRSINDLLTDNGYDSSKNTLKTSIEKNGHNSFRFFPTSPNIYRPFKK